MNRILTVGVMIAAVLLAGQVFAQDDYQFDVTMKETKKGKPQPPKVVHTTMSGKNARVDIPFDNEEWKKGDYLVTTDGGQSYTLVSPNRRIIRVYTEETLRASVARENKGLTVGDPQTAWTTVGPNQQHFTRQYSMSFRQGFITGKGKLDEVHDLTFAEPDAKGPSYNPFINYSLMDMASLLLKNPKFAATGLSSVVPKGFIRQLTIHVKVDIKSTMGGEKSDETATLETSVPVVVTVPPSTFVIPTDYKTEH